ncbi:MAG: glycosyltransferase [Candidatus Latescibacteria bacterium]|nr:glycosyltransferase [Candidatus Latescibacterota bacterium]
MKILWVDPLNTNAQFLNLMSIILQDSGHQVHVCSTARAAFPPPADIDWTPFSRIGTVPSILKNHPLTAARLCASYPFDWLRAIHRARAFGAKALLVSTNLMLPRLDTWAMRLLVRYRLAPVVIVHKPYQALFDDPSGKQAPRYRAFYRSAARILTMNRYTQQLLQKLYGLPDEKQDCFPHPHFQPLLDRFPTDRNLANRLKKWAAGAPVIAFLSNTRPEQGLEDLLASLPMLNNRRTDWRLLLVSPSSDQSYIKTVENQLAALGLQNRCWHQWERYSYTDLKAFLETATLVVAPYKQSTQSGVVAMATGAGLPVVATDIGGLPEMVQRGVNGELVPVGEPRSLAQAIATILDDPEQYRRGAMNCRQTLNSPQGTADAIAEALRSVSRQS